MQVLEHFSAVDGLVVLAYLVFTVVLGVAFRRQSSSVEFLLANRGMGWLPVGLSVMATLFSANSFLMVPGEASRYNLLIGMCLVGIVLTAPVVMGWFIPIYTRSGCFTAYELLEKRFDVRVRLLAASLFILLRIGWMAAATFSCSLAVAVISGTDLYLTVWVMGIITTIYTATGGIKAVMWNDVAQFAVFTVAIVGAVIIAMSAVPGGWSGTWSDYAAAGKLQVVDLRLDLSLRMGTWALVVGTFVETLSAYSTDQSIVQRYLTAPSNAVCQRAFLANLAGVLVVIPGLLLLGVALSGFYQTHPDRLLACPAEYFARRPADLEQVPGLVPALAARQNLDPAVWFARASADRGQLVRELSAYYKEQPDRAREDLYQVDRQDEVLPLFVRREMPRGMIGLTIAALLAATMSSIAGGIHSIATCIVVDFKNRLGRWSGQKSPAGEVRFLRFLTLLLGLAATALACVVDRLGTVFDMTKKLNGAFSGSLLAVFVLAFFSRRAKALPVLLAAVAGTGFTMWLTYLSQVQQLPSWLTRTGSICPMAFCVTGFLTSWILGYVGSLAFVLPTPKNPQ